MCGTTVTIDYEDAEQVERLNSAWIQAKSADLDDTPLSLGALRMRQALREFAHPSEPRMPEPDEVGSIVTASCCHSSVRTRWIKGFDNNWWREGRLTYKSPDADGEQPDDWDSLIDPQVTP